MLKTRKMISVVLALILMCVPVVRVAAEDNLLIGMSVADREIVEMIGRITDKNSDEIALFKQKGLYDEFISETRTKIEAYVAEDMQYMFSKMANWGIYSSTLVSEVEAMAQEYLNENFDGILIGSAEFEALIDEYLTGANMPIQTILENDSDFGSLYMYMCIYDSFILCDEDTDIENYSFYNSVSDISNLLMSDVALTISRECAVDFVPSNMIRKYVELCAESPYWPALNPTLIQNYAVTWANSFNPMFYTDDQGKDCTNFVSQALANGGLQMKFELANLRENRIVSTTDEWYNLYDPETGDFYVSTSFIRVVDLYDYLAPHYATLQAYTAAVAKRYINTGFVLQGRHIASRFSHSVIVTEKRNEEFTYCAHSNPSNMKPIDNFFDNFFAYRIVQVY